MQISADTPPIRSMTVAEYDGHAERFRLLAHGERLRILNVLRRDAECVCHLEAVLQKPQPYISQQLRILREAGVIVYEREGTNVFYRLIDEKVRQILDLTLGPAAGADRTAEPVRCICPKCNS
jgi:DNA-binding transcriptional ArsR family regulator